MTIPTSLCSDLRNSLLAKNPCVCIAALYIAGCLISHFTDVTFHDSYILSGLFVMAVCCILLAHILPHGKIFVLLSWFACAGFASTELHQSRFGIAPTVKHLYGRVISNPEDKPKSYKMTVEVQNDDIPCRVLCYLQKDSASALLRQGDVIVMDNTCTRVKNQEGSDFDYAGFLANQYIYCQQFVRSGTWRYLGHESSILSYCAHLRQQALHSLREAGLSDDNYAVIAALAFGDKSLLDEEIKGDFATAGAMHILAVSGLHVGIVNGLLLFLLSFIHRREHRWIQLVLCIGGVWFYACITGMSPSVQRAALMCSLLSCAILLRRTVSTYNSVAAAACISLFLSPNDLFSVSFQLSYAAVISILVLGSFIQSLIDTDTVIGSYLWGIVSVSVAVQVGTLPLTLRYFGIIPTYNMLTNIVVIPLAGTIVTGVFAVLATASIPTISTLMMSLLNGVTDYLRDCISDICSFPHAQIHIELSNTESCLLACVLILCALGVEIIRRRRLEKQVFAI